MQAHTVNIQHGGSSSLQLPSSGNENLHDLIDFRTLVI